MNANRMMVLVFREKLFGLLYMPFPAFPLLLEA